MASFFSLSNLFLRCSILLFSLLLCLLYRSSGIQQPLCDDGDRSSLLHFKQSLVFDKFSCDPSTDYTKLDSWKVPDDCCSWGGVDCDDETGHVIGLDLSSSCLYGTINSSSALFRLVRLTSLNLSYNNFNLSRIPGEIRSLTELKHLNLTLAKFSGLIPSSISNLSQLNVLELSKNYFSGKIPLSFRNMLQLKFLSLSYNNFNSSTLDWLGKLTNLQILDMEETNSYGRIPSSFRNLTELVELWLSSNQLNGQIPSWLGNSTQLTTLGFQLNELQGPIPDSIFQLPNIQVVDLHSNNLSGSLSFDSFLQSKYLYLLQLSENHLTLVSNTYVNVTNLPKFQILGLGDCSLREIPDFLHVQHELVGLTLSHNNISGYVPNWLFTLERLKFLDLANNFLKGFEHSASVTLSSCILSLLNLPFNNLEGPLPIPPSSIETYDVSQNKFSGDVSPLFCNLISLSSLDLSDNNLTGNLPPCFGNLGSSTLVLSLRNNTLTGKFPDNFTSACALKMIDFSQNKIEGKVPRSLVNCSKLEILNLEKNEMNDVFPSWLGILPRLRILSVRSNKLHGAIGKPLSKSDFNLLQIIDLSENNFIGKLPLEYFQNWVAMKSVDYNHLGYMEANTSFDVVRYYKWISQYFYFIRIVNKGTQRAYNQILNFFMVVDLSSNKFEGEIPEIVGTLRSVQSLNLSNNILTGNIPSSLGNLEHLEALDLSLNELSGEIPKQLSVLTFLSFFNVSYNNLTGAVPRGNQFETFQNDSFSDNPSLCGHPLSKKCGDTVTLPLPPSEDEEAESPFDFNWKIVVTGLGSGLVIGAAFGYALDTRKYEWLVKRKFARWRRSLKN